MVAKKYWDKLRLTFFTFGKLLLMITVPLMFILVFFSMPIVELIYQRGEFSAETSLAVNEIQILYFLQVPFYIIGILMVRIISSLRINKILMIGSFINLVLNIVFNYIFRCNFVFLTDIFQGFFGPLSIFVAKFHDIFSGLYNNAVDRRSSCGRLTGQGFRFCPSV